jgi:hypothetical protein
VPAVPAHLSFLGANGTVTGLADDSEIDIDYSGLRAEQEIGGSSKMINEATSQTVNEATSHTVAAIVPASVLNVSLEASPKQACPKQACESIRDEEASAMLSFAEKAVVTGFKSQPVLDGCEVKSPGIANAAYTPPTALRLQQAEAEVEVHRRALADALHKVSRVSSLVNESRTCSLVDTSDAVEAAARELYNARERYVISERARDYLRARVYIVHNAVDATLLQGPAVVPQVSTALAC